MAGLDAAIRALDVTLDEAAGTHQLATGQILLLAIQKPGSIAYKYDDTNPDARSARLLADRAIQTAAGRQPTPSRPKPPARPRNAQLACSLTPCCIRMAGRSKGVLPTPNGTQKTRR